MSILCGRITLPFIPTSRHHIYRHHRRRSLFSHRTTAAAAPENLAGVSPKSTLETLSFRQQEQISLYVTTLLQWNQRMNLTAVTQESDVMTRHVEDSLAILPPLRRTYLSRCSNSCDGLNIVDVGSGAGLPGLIFAIACPSWKVTLLESMHKRCLFLEHFVGLAGLSNVEILCERAELREELHLAAIWIKDPGTGSAHVVMGRDYCDGNLAAVVPREQRAVPLDAKIERQTGPLMPYKNLKQNVIMASFAHDKKSLHSFAPSLQPYNNITDSAFNTNPIYHVQHEFKHNVKSVRPDIFKIGQHPVLGSRISKLHFCGPIVEEENRWFHGHTLDLLWQSCSSDEAGNKMRI